MGRPTNSSPQTDTKHHGKANSSTHWEGQQQQVTGRPQENSLVKANIQQKLVLTYFLLGVGGWTGRKVPQDTERTEGKSLAETYSLLIEDGSSNGYRKAEGTDAITTFFQDKEAFTASSDDNKKSDDVKLVLDFIEAIHVAERRQAESDAYTFTEEKRKMKEKFEKELKDARARELMYAEEAAILEKNHGWLWVSIALFVRTCACDVFMYVFRPETVCLISQLRLIADLRNQRDCVDQSDCSVASNLKFLVLAGVCGVYPLLWFRCCVPELLGAVYLSSPALRTGELNKEKAKAAATIKSIQEQSEQKLREELQRKEEEADVLLKKAQDLAKAELAAAIASEKSSQMEKIAEANLHGTLALEDALSKGLPIRAEVDALYKALEGIDRESLLGLVLSSLPDDTVDHGIDTPLQLSLKASYCRCQS
ncbi:hypothetical protein M5K25_023037 [Dendrobium thyrsiflorum]|uniref:Uncharacterized protein n=1 Tax=Dendrobium thyrsiflorum TaxID=117978 RepID=A0ABD0UDU6_DENTH